MWFGFRKAIGKISIDITLQWYNIFRPLCMFWFFSSFSQIRNMLIIYLPHNSKTTKQVRTQEVSLLDSWHYWDRVFIRIEPLKAWHNVIKLEFIIYLMMFQFHFYLSSFHVLYFMSIVTCIFCIVRDLGALGVAQKI